jgi:integrase
MHNLRHTFATRCIEAGMRPKTLQKILGHSSLAMTMDLYVHVTNDELISEFDKIKADLVV